MVTFDEIRKICEGCKLSKFEFANVVKYLLQNELALTPTDPVNKNFWDNWFTIIGQQVTEQYELDTFAEIVQADWDLASNMTKNQEKNLSEISITKQQIELERLYNECVRKSPKTNSQLKLFAEALTSSFAPELPANATKLLEWIEENYSKGFNVYYYNWKAGEIVPIDRYCKQQQTAKNVVVVYDTDQGCLRTVMSRRDLYSSLKDYCDAIVVTMIENQELTKLLSKAYAKVPTNELPGTISQNLKTVGEIQKLSEFVKTLIPVPDESTDDVVNLKLLAKYDEQLNSQENDDAEKLLIELKTCYNHSVLRASEEVLAKRMAEYRQDALALQEKEEEIRIENDRLETLIEEAEEAKRQKEEKIKQLEAEFATANAEKSLLIQEELAQLKALDDKRAVVLRHKEEFSWNLLKKELISVELSYNNLKEYSSWRNGINISSSLSHLIEQLLSRLNFSGISPKNRKMLFNYCAKNDTSANKQDLLSILNSVFQPPSIGYNSKNSNILEIKGRQILASDVLQQMTKYNFSEVRIYSGTVLYLDASFQKSSFHGKNVTLCSPKLHVNSQGTIIDTSGDHGTPTGTPGKASSGYEPGRDGTDGMHGNAGESAGNVYIQAHQLENGSNLKIIANGGNGGQGQDGGDGKNGRDGYDGRNGHVEDSFWHQFYLCYRIDRGQSGQYGQRGGSGGIAGLGGEGGHPGEILIVPSNSDVTNVAKSGQQGKDGKSGRGANGGYGGRDGVDHGVAWHNYAFASGEFRYARGKLDVVKQNVWYGGNGYHLIVVRSEGYVRNSRAQQGQRGTDGHHRGNMNARRRAMAKSIASKQEISQNFSTVLYQFGQMQNLQTQAAAEMAAKLQQQQNELAGSEELARLEKIARDQEKEKTNAQIANTRNNINKTTAEKHQLTKNIAGLNTDLQRSMQDLSNTQEALKSETANAAAHVNELQGQMQQIATVVSQHKKQQTQQQLESISTNHQQSFMKDFQHGLLRTNVNILPKRVQQLQDGKKPKARDLEVRTEEKIQEKTKFWITKNPKQWVQLQKIFGVAKIEDCVSLFATIRDNPKFCSDSVIEKTKFKMLKFRNDQQPGTQAQLILDHFESIMQTHAEKWFVKQCASMEVIKEFAVKLDDLLRIVNNIIERAIDIFHPDLEYITGYKSFISVAENTSKYLKQTGDTLWEAFVIQLSGLGQSSFWYTSRKSVENSVLEHMDSLKLTLETVYRSSHPKRHFKVDDCLSLVKKLTFILRYFEANVGTEEMKLQLATLCQIQAKFDLLLVTITAGDTELFNAILEFGKEIYKNYVDNFQTIEVQLIQDAIERCTVSHKKRTEMTVEVNKFVEKLESPFSRIPFQDRIVEYATLRENIFKAQDGEAFNPNKILFGMKTLISDHALKCAPVDLVKVIKTLQVDFPVRKKLTELFSEIQYQHSALLKSCNDISQLETIELNDIISISNSLESFYFELMQKMDTYPPIMFQTLRDLQILLFNLWKVIIDKTFDSNYIDHERRMRDLDALRDKCLSLIGDYLQASDSILFKEEFKACLKIQLMKLTQGHLLLELKTGVQAVEQFLNAFFSQATSILENSKKHSDSIPSLCNTINDATNKLCQSFLQNSALNKFPEILSLMSEFIESPVNIGHVHSAVKKIQQLTEPNELLEDIASLIMYNYRLPVEAFQIQGSETSSPKNEAEMEQLLKTLETMSSNKQQRSDNLQNALLVANSPNYLEYGWSLQSLLSKYLELRFKSTRESQQLVAQSLQRLFAIFYQNPKTVLSYSEPMNNFATKVLDLSGSKTEDMVTQINHIFIESCIKFFKFIPTLPSKVLAQVWHLFSKDAKLSNIISMIVKEIGKDVDGERCKWVMPFLSILREFLQQLPSEFPTSCGEIHQMCLEILGTSKLIEQFLKKDTSRFVTEYSTPLVTVIVDLSRRICLNSLKRKYQNVDERLETVQFMNQAEFAFWAIFEGAETEMSTLTQIFCAMENNNYKQSVASIFASKCCIAFNHLIEQFPSDFQKHWDSSLDLDNGNSLWLKYAAAAFFLSSNANINETSLCERIFLGELIFRPEFSKKEAVNYFLQSEFQVENRVATALLYSLSDDDADFTFLNLEEQKVVSMILEIAYNNQVTPMLGKIKNILKKSSSDEWFDLLQSLYMDLQLQNILELFTTNFLPKPNQDWKPFTDLLTKFSSSHYDDSDINKELLTTAAKINPILRDTVEDLLHMKHLFNRCYVFAEDKVVLNIWFQNVYKNCQTQEIHLTELSDLLARSVDIPPNQLLKLTLASNAENWIESILTTIVSMNVNLFLDKAQDFNMESSDSLSRSDDLDASDMTRKLEKVESGFLKNRLLATFADKIAVEIEFVSAGTFAKDRHSLVEIFNNIEQCGRILSEEFIDALKEASFFRWSYIFRRYTIKLQFGTEELTTAILNFEAQNGSLASEKLLAAIGKMDRTDLLQIFNNFNRMRWTFDEIVLKEIHKSTGTIENVQTICEKYTQEYLKKDRKASDIASIMAADPGNSGIFDTYLRQVPMSNEKNAPLDICKLEQLVRGIKEAATKTSVFATDIKIPIGQFEKSNIAKWVKTFNSLTSTEKIRIAQTSADEMIAVASRVLQIQKGYGPRDTQLISILLLLEHSLKGRSSLAEVATGEGKTIILAIVVGIRVLCGDDVDIITSSSVLAKANLEEVLEYYAMFGISATVNCDEDCERSEDTRKERYQNNRVIYGDVGSFQRDILLTEFFNKNITMNRTADVVFVDEVDSMLLDKGENVLYLSHQIPELRFLWPLTIEIWQAVHGPDVSLGREQDVVLIVKFIQRRISVGDIIVPKSLMKFIDFRLVHWVRNAFLARNIKEKDSYVVANLDKKGHKVVIMDKGTGVEQVNMQWSNGLHQYVQLKHSDKLSAESLKAVFMSNIAYIQRYKGRLFGISGTLGSKIEQDLLAKCYSVEFFKIPRFKARRCYEVEGIVAEDSEGWLTQIQECTEDMRNSSRAVLIIAENVDMVEFVVNRLKNVLGSSQVYSYASSFDKDFTKRRAAGPVTAKDVIVATNIAGRGTDFKTDKYLNNAGGIHVILSYVPGNVRIEEQAFGRTARAGANGSVQYVINAAANIRTKDSEGRMQRLDDFKYERDNQERERLDQFRIKSMPQIECEHDLSLRFGQVLKKVKENLKHLPEELINLHIENLQNRWAFWLDSMSERVKMTHSQKDIIFREFDNFESRTLQSCNNLIVSNGSSQGFEAGPVEMTKLGRRFEEDEKLSQAMSHFNRAIKTDPQFSEIAHYYMASCIIKQTDEGVSSKRQAIGHLKIAEKLIRQRMNALFASSQALQLIDDMRREMGQGTSANRYQIQVKSQAELLKVHLGKIGDAIGSQIDGEYLKGIRGVLDDAEGEEIFKVLQRHSSILKSYRFSKKIRINANAAEKEQVRLPLSEIEGQYKDIIWPHTLSYCKPDVLNFIQNILQKDTRFIEENSMERFIVTKSGFWAMLKAQNFISQEENRQERLVAFKENEKKYESHSFPSDLVDFKSIFAKMLVDLDKSAFDETHLELFDLTEEQRKRAMTVFSDTNVVQKTNHQFAKITCELKYDKTRQEWIGIPAALSKYESLVSALIEETDENGNVRCKSEISLNEIPLFETKTQGVGQLWSFMLDSGMVKPPKVRFHIVDKQGEIDQRFDEIEEALKNSSDLDRILKKYHPDKDTRPSVDDIMAIMRQAVGKIRTIPKIEVSYEELSEYFKTGLYPPEIEEFRDNMFFHLLECSKKQSWWDWDAFIVAMLGVAQIIAGVLLEVFTAGIATHFAMALISEGIGDIAFAIEAGINKNFSWKDYGIHKAISVTISIVTAGIGAWVSRGAQVARFAGKTGFQLFKAVGTRVMRKLSEAVAYSLADIGIEKILDAIREKIIDGCKTELRNSVDKSSNAISGELDEAMNLLADNCYENGQAQRLIKDAFSGVLSDVTGGVVGTKISNKVADATSEIASQLNTASGKLLSHGKNAAQNMNLGAGSSALSKGVKLAQIAKYIGYVLQTAKIVKALTEMGTYAETIIQKLIQRIKATATTLKKQKKGMSSTFTQNASEFAEFKTKFNEDIKVNIIDYIMTKIQSAMLQPAFNKLTNATLKIIGNATVAKTSSILKSLGKDRNIQLLTEYRGSNVRTEEQITAALQGKVDTSELSPDTELTVRSGKGPDGSVITLQDAKTLYGDNVELYQDKKGRFYFQQPSFDHCVNSFGTGKAAGFMELINCARYLKATIQIEDLTGDLKTDSPDGFTYINGSSSKGAPVMELVYTKDVEGVGHFQPKVNGAIYDLSPPTDNGRNTSLYQSLQFLQGKASAEQDSSPEKFITGAKSYAMGSNTMKTLYKKGVYELAAKFQASMPMQKTLTKVELDQLQLSQNVGKKISEDIAIEELKTEVDTTNFDDTPTDDVEISPEVLDDLDNRRVVYAKVTQKHDVKAMMWEKNDQAKRYGSKSNVPGQFSRMRRGSLDETNRPGFSTMAGIPHNRIRSTYGKRMGSFHDYGYYSKPRKEYYAAKRNSW